MEVFALLFLTMVVTTCVSASESILARGFDEGPWSSNQQPEILIVKEKGGSQSAASSSSKMKDLTPLLCLLAPLLLAAILLPSKMTMMMNGMMGSNQMVMPNMMMPMPQNMMMPGAGPLYAFPLTAMLSSGLGSNSKPLSLPLFKSMIESKKFSEDGNHLGDKNNATQPSDGLANGLVINIFERSKENKENEWYVADTQTTLVPFEHKPAKDSKKHKRRKGDPEKSEWSSRVWPAEKSKTTLADEMLNLFDEIWNTF